MGVAIRKAVRVKKKRSIRRMILKKLRKVFYKVANKPLFEQKISGIAFMIGGVICAILEPQGHGGGVWFITIGLLIFCTKTDLSKDCEN